MNITRRNFIKFATVAGVIAGTNLVAPRFAPAQKRTQNAVGDLPADVLNDPLYSLTAADFKNCIGSEFTLLNALDGASATAVLSKVTVVKKSSKSSKGEVETRRSGKAENFTLAFALPAGELPQATYTLWHPSLGQFDLLLVPGRGNGGENLLHAVINRV